MSASKQLNLSKSKLTINTFKEGLLSKLAHDLTIEASDAEGTLDGTALSLNVKALSLAVVSDNVSTSQKDEIRGNMRKSVLDAKRYPDVLVTIADVANASEAEVTIKGRRVKIPVTCAFNADTGVVEVSGEMKQTAFGIKPSSAMLGALKIQDRVKLKGSLHFE